MSLTKINEIYQEAINCRECFKSGCAYAGKVAVNYSQPRPVGSRYFESSPKTLVILVNPGSVGNKNLISANHLNNLLRDYQSGAAGFLDVNEHLTHDMQNWGVRRSREDQNKSFCKFYFEDMGLNIKKTAFVNIALCGAKDEQERNAYPACLLKNCFEKFTKRLIEVFSPDLCVISGSAIQSYRGKIQQVIPKASIKSSYHYAYRSRDESKAIASAEAIRGFL